jgi:hypothetical protein
VITENNQLVEIQMSDAAGRIVRKEYHNALKGSNTFNLTGLRRLVPGVYLIQARAGGITVTKKMYKE